MIEHLLLMDASGFAFRAFHSQNPRYRESDGEPTGAIEVFMGLTWRMLGAAQADPPTMGAAVFDAPGKNFRHALFPAYKANRDPSRRVELDKQFPIMRAAAEVLGLTSVECSGFEADDVIATLAHRARRAGIRTTIVSSDKDFSQCVDDGKIEIVDPLAKKRALTADVIAKFGVPPAQVPDVQALAGDIIDGIPGIPGCGLKTAAALVRRFGGLEQVLKHADECRFPQVRAQLKRRADEARLYLKLTTLRRNVPIKIKFEDLRLKPVVRSHLIEILRALEAEGRAESIFGLDPQMLRAVDKVKSPLEWWREELAAPGQRLPDLPQCGFYMRRLIKGGAFVPARIWRDPEYDLVTDTPTGREILRCELGTRAVDPMAEWVRLSAQPISEAEYRKMMLKWQAGKPPPPTSPPDLSKVQSIPNPRLRKRA